jgi:hypothetical protein
VKILVEFIDQILSTIPVLHANRLYLLYGLICIKPCLPGYQKEIESHISLLRENIDVEKIINIELKNQDIYIIDGISLVYILLLSIKMEYPKYEIDFSTQLFFNKIKKSEAWNTLLNREYYNYNYRGLLNGFPGVYLILLHINRHSI